jgi:hypothetical protein
MVRLLAADKLLVEALRFEVLSSSLYCERDGEFLLLAAWNLNQQGWISAREPPVPLPLGMRQLSLRAKEPLRLGFHGQDGYEYCFYDGRNLSFRPDGRGGLALVSSGATVARLQESDWRPSDRQQAAASLVIAEWGTPPLFASFAPEARRRPSGLATS